MSEDELIEKAAQEYAKSRVDISTAWTSFSDGARWQAKRMYSKENLREAIAEAWNSCEDNEDNESFTQVFNRIIDNLKQQ